MGENRAGSGRGDSGRADKAERLAAALRANLKRRKQQARERSEAGAPDRPEDGANPPPASEKPRGP